MYKAILSGSATGKSGRFYRFTAGKTVDAEQGELDHAKSVIWVGEEESEYPVHKGAGYYELSNGETVRGKEEAIEAENELNES
jgi:phage-related protein